MTKMTVARRVKEMMMTTVMTVARRAAAAFQAGNTTKAVATRGWVKLSHSIELVTVVPWQMQE
jgi:hypothetical protein